MCFFLTSTFIELTRQVEVFEPTTRGHCSDHRLKTL
jgi:hypothetical protein